MFKRVVTTLEFLIDYNGIHMSHNLNKIQYFAAIGIGLDSTQVDKKRQLTEVTTDFVEFTSRVVVERKSMPITRVNKVLSY